MLLILLAKSQYNLQKLLLLVSIGLFSFGLVLIDFVLPFVHILLHGKELLFQRFAFSLISLQLILQSNIFMFFCFFLPHQQLQPSSCLIDKFLILFHLLRVLKFQFLNLKLQAFYLLLKLFNVLLGTSQAKFFGLQLFLQHFLVLFQLNALLHEALTQSLVLLLQHLVLSDELFFLSFCFSLHPLCFFVFLSNHCLKMPNMHRVGFFLLPYDTLQSFCFLLPTRYILLQLCLKFIDLILCHLMRIQHPLKLHPQCFILLPIHLQSPQFLNNLNQSFFLLLQSTHFLLQLLISLSCLLYLHHIGSYFFSLFSQAHKTILLQCIGCLGTVQEVRWVCGVG